MMENREKNLEAVPEIDSGKIFSVWVDEGGRPQFFEHPSTTIPPEYFVHVDPHRAHFPGDYLLLSTLEGLFFGQTNADGVSVRIGACSHLIEPPLLVMGVVIAGFEWFTLP
jgi:hypothetical protein